MGKQSGGNEFISHEIFLQTGKVVSRKQVSSHIQVLKNFYNENDKCWSTNLPCSILCELTGCFRDEPR